MLLDYHGPLLKYITKLCKGVFSAILLMFVVQNETYKKWEKLTNKYMSMEVCQYVD